MSLPRRGHFTTRSDETARKYALSLDGEVWGEGDKIKVIVFN